MPYSAQSHDIKKQQTRLKIWEINTGPVSRRYKHDPAAAYDTRMRDLQSVCECVCVCVCVCVWEGGYSATLSVAKCVDRVTPWEGSELKGQSCRSGPQFNTKCMDIHNTHTHIYICIYTHTYIHIYLHI